MELLPDYVRSVFVRDAVLAPRAFHCRMPSTVTLPDSHPTTTLQADASICKGFSHHRHHQELPYPASEHFLPNQASILTSFGKKCSFFNCEPCITGRSAQSLTATHFAAEIKLQITELWTTACKNDRRHRRDRRYRLTGKPLQLLDSCGWDRQS